MKFRACYYDMNKSKQNLGCFVLVLPLVALVLYRVVRVLSRTCVVSCCVVLLLV